MRIFLEKYLVNTHLRIIFAACFKIEHVAKIQKLSEKLIE